MDPDEPVCVKVAERLYVGNIAAATSAACSVDLVINVSGDDVSTIIPMHSYILPNQELLLTERQKIISRLAPIKKLIANNSDQTILICCYDGRNQALLVAGYYLICEQGLPAADVVDKLEKLYFTAELVEDERKDQLRVANVDPDMPPETFTAEAFAALTLSRETRRGLRGFVISSFKSLLLAL